MPLPEIRWRKVVDNMLDDLRTEELRDWVKVEAMDIKQGFPPFQTHPDGWKFEGYALIDLRLYIPAIMDENGRISENHEVRVLIPRGYPEDAIKWGIFFDSEPPFHPNIAKLDENGLSIVSGRPYGSSDPPVVSGTICIGMAGADTRPIDLLRILRKMLLMEDKRMFIDKSEGGLQDSPWDKGILDICFEKYDAFRSAIEQRLASQQLSQPTRTNTGGGLRRRTGKRSIRPAETSAFEHRSGLRRRK